MTRSLTALALGIRDAHLNLQRYVKLLPDGWTVVTKDHSVSAQWEHTLLVTETGHEVLTCRHGDTL